MAASENKTKPTPESVDAFLETIPDATKRSDCQRLRELMESVTGEEGMLWGPSMVGFGTYHYRYASGHEGDSMAVGFALRSANITLYTTGGIGGVEDHEPVLQRLGRYKTGKGFLSIKRLSDVDEDTLTDLITASVTTAAEVNVNLARAVIRTHDLDTGRVARLGRGLTSGRGVIVAQTVVSEKPSKLELYQRALVPGGVLFVSFKLGEGEAYAMDGSSPTSMRPRAELSSSRSPAWTFWRPGRRRTGVRADRTSSGASP